MDSLTTEASCALEVHDLHTYYGHSHVLHGLNLKVPAGRTVAVVGRNGVGKTTFVNSVMGIVKAKSGRVSAFGSDIGGWPTHRIARAGIQIVPQGRRLFPSLTVEEHLVLASRLGSGRVGIDWAYDKFPSLKERSDAYSHTLSGGEQSQLSIARAVLAEPQMILMDEPTEGLSPIIVNLVGELIDQLTDAGTSILLVEQNLKFALQHCSRVAIMSRGQVIHEELVEAGMDSASFVAHFMGMQSDQDEVQA